MREKEGGRGERITAHTRFVAFEKAQVAYFSQGSNGDDGDGESVTIQTQININFAGLIPARQ